MKDTSVTLQCAQFNALQNCSWTPNGGLGFDTLEHDVSAALRLIHQIKLQELIQKQVDESTALSGDQVFYDIIAELFALRAQFY